MTYIVPPLAGLGGGISWRPPTYSLLLMRRVCVYIYVCRLSGVLQHRSGTRQHRPAVNLRAAFDRREHRRQAGGDRRHGLPPPADHCERHRRTTVGRCQTTVGYVDVSRPSDLVSFLIANLLAAYNIVVRTLVSAGELSVSCARLLAGWLTTLWLSRPLSVSQHGQLSHPSLRGR